ncbi:hypothetical protein PAAG_04256 [Paracoccidioides lutzii Pb01]|uniref:Uncharacterized protein n=1 Tax=Paracoccidioides lutzii (strain ATCC MYA-826 / Pb01) TaxID=502779 RepID=C1H0G2_PARBA|nr:hypothetical protein PAAG_04256 [Paracoccidioides lutzii Pb01]EEH33203.2 hypothetical protein PAAG_04256 [Paracoccidioides lutzii Pb01]
MVNLRSGGTPGLTEEYVPKRRQNRGSEDRTPENRTPEPAGSLPTPITVCRSAPGVFEIDKTILEESNESNNAYEDLVDEMSENTVDPSGQVSGVSEETLMRLEIAELQREVEMIRASREALTTNASGNEMSEDLVNYLQRRGRTTAIMKILAEFRDQVKHIKKSVILTGSANYPMWREEILLAAKQSETDDILNQKQSAPEDGASMDMQRFWTERNVWLYNHMWSAISPAARSHFTIPSDHQLSAYILWTIIEENFSERPAVRRTRLRNYSVF